MSEWKMVPVEPTEEMTYAARYALAGDRSGNIAAPVYRAMIAAAPPAPTSPTYIVETSADTHAWHPASTHASAEAADRAARDLMLRLPGMQFVRIRREDAPPAPDEEQTR